MFSCTLKVVAMGFEFKIRLSKLDPDQAGQVLRAAPFYSDYDPANELFNFRNRGKQPSDWPALWAKIDSDGIYLCDNGDREVFQAVVDYIRHNVNEATQDFCMDEL